MNFFRYLLLTSKERKKTYDNFTREKADAEKEKKKETKATVAILNKKNIQLEERKDKGGIQSHGSAPSQPQPPSVAFILENSMMLQWLKRPCDDEFTLQMDDLHSGHGFLPLYNGTGVEHIVRGLERNKDYRFLLRAHNKMGSSEYSALVSYTTRPGRPSPPTSLMSVQVKSRSFKIIWNVPLDNGGVPVTFYHLEIDDGFGWSVLYSGKELEYVCRDLLPGAVYMIQVMADGPGGLSEYSETCIVTTDTEPTVPEADEADVISAALAPPVLTSPTTSSTSQAETIPSVKTQPRKSKIKVLAKIPSFFK